MTDLKPGRELDALVAERVMGWIRLSCAPPGRFCLEQKERGRDERDGDWWLLPGGTFRCDLCDRTEDYSTDIRAAWEIMEKMWPHVQNGGRGTHRIQLYRRDGDNQWGCEFAIDPQGDWRTHARACAPTAPHAICLAALKAIEGESKDD